MKHVSSLFTFFSGVTLLTVAAIPTFAIEIKYNTVGTFSCNGLAGCTVTSNAAGDASVTVQDASGNQSKLVFIHSADDSLYADDNSEFPAAFEAGVITPSGLKKGDPFVAGLNQVSLDIKVFQTIPSPTTSGDFVGELTGKVSTSSKGINSSAKITFGAVPPSIALDGVVYQLDNSAYVINVNGPTIQGPLAGTALPEPAFFTLTGIGFFWMLFIAWSLFKLLA